jgi:hypothetical protein
MDTVSSCSRQYHASGPEGARGPLLTNPQFPAIARMATCFQHPLDNTTCAPYTMCNILYITQ